VDTNKQGGGIAAVVLAAGMSRRMGTPKQLLRVGDKTLLEHALANVRASEVSEVVLVLGGEAESVRQQVGTRGVKLVVNPHYEQGMGTSLSKGLSLVGDSCHGALIVLADQPLIRPTTLNRLIEFHSQTGAQITIPLYRGFRGNPVLLDRSVFSEVMTLAGDVGCRAIFGDHTEGIRKIEVSDPGILLDIDTEEDLRRLQRVDFSAVLPTLEGSAQAARPKTDLVIVGRDDVARAIAKQGRLLGFAITLVDPFIRLREAPEADGVLHTMDFTLLPAGEKFFVIASRGQFDEEAVEQAIRSNATYVGLLANRKRAAELLNTLRQRGIPEKQLQKVKAPAGLDIGAKNPEEIALSIVAEIVAERAHRGTQPEYSGTSKTQQS